MQTGKTKLTQTFRVAEWWEYKLSPLLATMYATAYLLGKSVFELRWLLVLALLAIIPGAAYVSVLNDLTDLRDDVASEKHNRLVGQSKLAIAILLAVCILPGVIFAVYWRRAPLLLTLYLAAWVAFSLYSLPPVRLKNRGVGGILADASGAHLFPTLLLVALVFHWQSVAVDRVWFAAVAVWAFAYGLRGILWHQLGDAQNDAKIGLRTFALRHRIGTLQQIGNFIIFPAELVAFAILLWRAGSRLALIGLIIYGLIVWARRRLWGVNLVIVNPQPGANIVMQEYYGMLYPSAILLSSALRFPADAIMLIVHLLLFPARPAQYLSEGWVLARAIGRKLFNHRH